MLALAALTALIGSAPGPLQQLGAGIIAGRGLAERLQRLAGLVVQLGRDHHLHGDQQVAVEAIRAAADAPALDPECAPVRCTGRDPHRDRHAPVRRNLDLRAQRRLAERHGHADREVVAGPAEHLVRGDVHLDVQVTGRPAALTRGSLALELDPLAVRHAGRDARLDGPGAHRPAAPRAHRAGVVDYHAASAALAARLGQREAAQVPAGLAGAVTGRADPGYGTRLGAGPVAGRARSLARQAQRNGGSVDRVSERERGLGLDVGPAPRPGLRAAPAEHPAQQIAQPAAGRVAAAPAEQVAQVEVVSARGARAGGARHSQAPATEQRPRLVVLLAPFLVRQDVVRLGDLLEALLRRGVVLVGVGGVFPRQLAVGLLDLIGGGVLGDAEDLVVVLL